MKIESKKIRIMLLKAVTDTLPAVIAMKGQSKKGRIFFFNSGREVLIQNKTDCAAIATR